MIPTLSSLAQPLLLATTTISLYAFGLKSKENAQNEKFSLIQRVWNVAIGIFKVAVSLFHYWVNPTFASLAFFGTIIWAKEVEELASRVKNAWHKQPWSFSCLTIAAAKLSMPVALITGTIFWSCSMGLDLAYKQPIEQNP